MTLQQLRCFVAVSQSLSFAAAARQLYLSQPAVTRQIQTLESELEVRLLERSRHSVVLTAAGVSFLADAADILDRLELAEQRVRDQARQTLHLGWEDSLQSDRLPRIYAAYRQRYPAVAVSAVDVPATERRKMLLNGQIDVMFTVPSGIQGLPHIRYETLYAGHFICALPKGHRLARRPLVTAEDLAGEVLILLDAGHCPPEMDRLQQRLRREHPNFTFCHSGSVRHSLPMIEGGLGVAIMPDFICPARSGVAAVPFAADQPIEYGMAWNSRGAAGHLTAFLQAAREGYGLQKA